MLLCTHRDTLIQEQNPISMRFQVPQFIEVENKIFGPFTFRQFAYLAGAAGMVVALWQLLPTFFALLLSAPVVLLALALAFYKVNDRPFITVLESAVYYAAGNKLYMWKKREKKKQKEKEETEDESIEKPGLFVPRISESKLKDIAWSLDVHESLYGEESEEQRKRAREYAERATNS